MQIEHAIWLYLRVREDLTIGSHSSSNIVTAISSLENELCSELYCSLTIGVGGKSRLGEWLKQPGKRIAPHWHCDFYISITFEGTDFRDADLAYSRIR
jgi:hypothetical protein